MAQQREKGGRVVFIGNIPYGVSEEQICEIFGRVGQVVSFRLVYDKETGRPKGFGFLEYTDVDAAASAVRNLNGSEIMGRTLKVDYSNDNSGTQRNQNQNQQPDLLQAPGQFGAGPVNGASDLPPLPPGTDVPPGLTAPDAISQTLANIPPPQLLDFISQMKSLVTADPAKATALLHSAPQLSYATFQALLLLGLVDTNVVTSLLAHTAPQQQPATQPAAPPMQYTQPPAPQSFQPPFPQTQPPQHFGGPQPPPGQFQAYAQPSYNATPPVPQPAYQPPAPAQAQPQTQQGGAPDQAALIQRLLSMTREEIFAQDEATRNTILQLRAQYGAPVS